MDNSLITLLQHFYGTWNIEENFALQEFGKYIDRMSMIKSGATFSDVFTDIKVKSLTANMLNKTGGSSYISNISDINAPTLLELTYSGVMLSEDGMCSYGVQSLVDMLYQAYDNKFVTGVLLSLNSGGGQSSSAYLLQQALQDKNKPVVVHTNLLASAALNGSVTASEIIALSDGTEIGSIGSYISINKESLTRLAETTHFIYSDLSPNKNKDIRDAMAGDFTALKAYVNENAKMFQKKVTQHLSLNPDMKDETLSGGMFLAQDAKKRGLIHGVGTKGFAIKRISSLIKFT
jgi:ClpP class serine protease